MKAAALRRLLAPELAHGRVPLGRHRPAAVLVALEPGRGVWLTRRQAVLSAHAGQVAFPGGKIDPEDASAEDAALREASEEIGLAPADVELLGRLDDLVTGTGFHIAPVVGLVPEGVRLVAAADEVAALFCLSFPALLDPQLPLRRVAALHGRRQEFWLWPHPDHVIWGATAVILRQLALRLRGDA